MGARGVQSCLGGELGGGVGGLAATVSTGALGGMSARTWIGNKPTWGHPAQTHYISLEGLLTDGLEIPPFLVKAVPTPASFSGWQREVTKSQTQAPCSQEANRLLGF